MMNKRNQSENQSKKGRVSEEEKQLLDERYAAYQRNPKRASTLEEVKARLMDKFQT